ncbi:hypothetical protein AYX13_03051 [Cryptococcus neoformans]|nr:hypothetical protein AYX13_03051 [Cryptococcus neoformans var. grubii]
MAPSTRLTNRPRLRVSYLWSPSLQRLSDDLPSNVGRSSMVHDLIKSLNLLDFEELKERFSKNDKAEDEDGKSEDDDDNEADRIGVKNVGDKQGAGGEHQGRTPDSPTESPTQAKHNKATVVFPEPSLGTKACLLRYHDRSYIERLLKADTDKDPDDPTHLPSSPSSSTSSPRPAKIARTDPYNLSHDNPVFPSLASYISHIAAATSTACRLLATDKADWAVCWDGGRHHAKRKEAGGFCYVNDLVLGGLLLSREGRIPIPLKEGEDPKRQRTRAPRIFYLDMDLHYSDGVSAAFHSPTVYPYPLKESVTPPKPPNVLTLSIHHSSPVFFPPPTPISLLPSPNTGSPFSLSIPLSAYPSRQTYAKVFNQCILPIRDAWDPDYVILQLGTDGLPGDRVGQYGNWSVDGEGGIKWVVQRVKEWGKKVCVTGGGGYRHDNAARAWAEVMGVLLDRDFEEDTPIPHHDHFEQYAPSFTLQVPASHMRDENKPEDLEKAAEVFDVLAKRIKIIVDANS